MDRPREGAALLLVAESPEKVHLVGFVGETESSALADCCHQMRALGRSRLQLEMSAVTDVTAPALSGIIDLAAGSSGLHVTICGARWGQFMALLADVPISAVQSTCDAIRSILTTDSPRPPSGRHRRTTASPSALAPRHGAAFVPEPRRPDEQEPLGT